MPWACRGFQDVTMKGHPYSETSRDQSGGNGKQSGLAHLSSPVQSARPQQAVWSGAVCRTMVSAAVMAITKWSISGSEKKDPRSGLRLVKFAITTAQFYLSPYVAAYLAGRVHRAVPPNQTSKLSSGGQWLHEIKHDGFRIMPGGTARECGSIVARATTSPAASR
jgi:ATP-dependent DNA ligase